MPHQGAPSQQGSRRAAHRSHVAPDAGRALAGPRRRFVATPPRLPARSTSFGARSWPDSVAAAAGLPCSPSSLPPNMQDRAALDVIAVATRQWPADCTPRAPGSQHGPDLRHRRKLADHRRRLLLGAGTPSPAGRLLPLGMHRTAIPWRRTAIGQLDVRRDGLAVLTVARPPGGATAVVLVVWADSPSPGRHPRDRAAASSGADRRRPLDASRIDPLTASSNRRGHRETLDHESERARRNEAPLVAGDGPRPLQGASTTAAANRRRRRHSTPRAIRRSRRGQAQARRGRARRRGAQFGRGRAPATPTHEPFGSAAVVWRLMADGGTGDVSDGAVARPSSAGGCRLPAGPGDYTPAAVRSADGRSLAAAKGQRPGPTERSSSG